MQAVSVWRWQHEELSLIDSACRIKQAQQVLSLWLEAPIKKDSGTDHLIGAVITLLDGIPELMDSVEGELVDMDLSLDGKA